MDGFDMFTNYTAIISGTTNMLSPAYMEAAKESENNGTKSLAHIKNFITSIESVSSKGAKDSRITASKGNIKEFSGYEDIKTTMNFLTKNLSKVGLVKELSDILGALERYQPIYSDGYTKKVRLVQLEYENAVYMLVTGLSLAMADGIEVVQNGESIKIQKKAIRGSGIIVDVTKKLAKEMNTSAHKEYLESLIKGTENKGSLKKAKAEGNNEDTKKEDAPKKEEKKEEPKKEEKPAKEEPKEDKKEEKPEEKKDDKKDDSKEENKEIKESVAFMEASAVADTVDLIDLMLYNVKRIGAFTKRSIVSIKNSLFGILPLIRSIIYLRYKKKADTVVALEQQADFINKNIEQLENLKTMDPKKKAEVIKKQKAISEAYMKKAAKLKAQLIETEKDATAALSHENPSMKEDKKTETTNSKPDSNSSNDDFVLEGVKISDIYGGTENE